MFWFLLIFIKYNQYGVEL